MDKEISLFLINPDTKTPITAILKISRILNGLNNTEPSEIDEAYMIGLFYKYATEEPELFHEDATSKFIDWFNETKIERFINEVLTDDEYQKLEKVWQDLKK